MVDEISGSRGPHSTEDSSAPVPVQAIDTVAADPYPSFVESVLVLGLLLIAMVGCWMLYGPIIRAMAMAILRMLQGQ